MKSKKYFVFAGLSSLCAVTFLGGCSTILLFDPKGPIAAAERFVIIAAIVLMLIVVIPVFIMAFWFPRTYRASNSESTYMPKWSYSAKIDFFMWAVPIAIVTVLAILAWTSTHSLDPYKPIHSADKPINIEAVSLDWKWLFIYPDQNIATVNQITFPVNVPVSFKLTSDTVMTSFFIPQLGSQIYAMAGMQTRLHLLADKPGTYAGHNQQFSGRGYADMHFKANAVSREEFQSWVQEIRQSPEKLDLVRYEKLANPSTGHSVTYFSSVTPDLFGYILRKFDPTWGKNPDPMSRESVSTHARTDVAEAN
ncbi:MAG TPA: ubiquinol oxidase subunit II [Desulfomonilaceae bacterium]|nr:ubiquinol oxidase subunit II [Desulfomonilaceae bacterium]